MTSGTLIMPLLKPEDAKDHVQAYRTSSLFYEVNQSALEPVFTLKNQDLVKGDKVYKAIYPIYMEMEDITEYKFAMAVFGSWEQWKKVCSGQLILAYVNKWREELEIKLRSDLLCRMADMSKEGSKGFTAAKYLADKGYETVQKIPPKKAAQRKERIAESIHKEVAQDLQRIDGAKPH